MVIFYRPLPVGGVWFIHVIMIIPHGKKAPENVHGSSLEIVIRPLT